MDQLTRNLINNIEFIIRGWGSSVWQKVKSRRGGRLEEGGSAIIQKGSGHVGRGVGPLINSGFARPTRFGNE